MNIFALDRDPVLCAHAHCDKHVIKMILEHTQMVCTVAHAVGIPNVPYKPAHRNHPCTLWVGQSCANVQWLYDLTIALNNEKQHRFGSGTHASMAVMHNIAPQLIERLADLPMTPFAQAMPDEVRVLGDSIAAYRLYYRKHKQHLHQWSNRVRPHWL